MFARIFSRRHKQTTFSDAGFLGVLRVKYILGKRGGRIEQIVQSAAFDQGRHCLVGGGGGGGWGSGEEGGNLGVRGNCGTGVRANISKPTPFIYLAFEKNRPIHILDHPKC